MAEPYDLASKSPDAQLSSFTVDTHGYSRRYVARAFIATDISITMTESNHGRQVLDG